MGTGVAPRKTLGMSSKLKLLQQHQRDQGRLAQRGPGVLSTAQGVSTAALSRLVAKTTAKKANANVSCIQSPTSKRAAAAADPKRVAAKAGNGPVARLRGDSGGGSRRSPPPPKRASRALPKVASARSGARSSHMMSPLAGSSTSATVQAAASASSTEAEARRALARDDEETGVSPRQSTSVEALTQAAVLHAAARRRAPGVLVETLGASSNALLGKPLNERKQVLAACLQVGGHVASSRCMIGSSLVALTV
jgi:hypothetical protein